VDVHDVVDVHGELHPGAAEPNTTPGDRWSCETTTRSAPLITNVPSGVRMGSSPR
jgi:hypothetical protein